MELTTYIRYKEKGVKYVCEKFYDVIRWGRGPCFKEWSPATSISKRPDLEKNNSVRAKPGIRRTADEKKMPTTSKDAVAV
ncbi:MAG: hypothetical protein SRB2_03166 [Desulfobacteraceae bacterium Eth-SRB2]|nr:MAG: hypothetical protein SRB2_03166 [Desulfobacteraceae bacterium Eth-SRB2]